MGAKMTRIIIFSQANTVQPIVGGSLLVLNRYASHVTQFGKALLSLTDTIKQSTAVKSANSAT